MTWDDESWAAFTAVLRHGFASRDEFTDDRETVYRLLLDKVEPAAAMRAVQEMVLAGQALLPQPGEIVSKAQADHRRPTFDEAFYVLFQHLYSPLKAQTTGEAVNRAMSFHPLIARFVQVMGRDRLAYMEVFDPDYGRVRRQELRTTWQEIDETTRGRDVAAMVAGSGERRGQLGRFDPLRALGVADRHQLEPGRDIGEAA